ncbi:NusA N-terminal domain-containing protein, partial [Priestia megaterium]|uniref:NusA N-terminal domain-containing protein n=1 Tax=Priestia megaterium TaxID=1404 RepID=UPI0028475EF2
MNREFIDALEQLKEEKHIEKGVLLEAIESALLAAYRRNYSTTGNINVDNVRVDIESETGDISVLSRLEVVEEVMDENREISLDDAR